MKLLVCTDGSEHSRKALEKAALVATAPFINEVALINVYDGKVDLYGTGWGGRDYIVTEEDVARLRKIHEDEKLKRQKMLEEDQKMFAEQGIDARIILKEGHPAHTIVEVAEEEGFDMIVIGSRGYGGLKKLLLGSVSNAVAQEAKSCCVLIVK